MEIEGKIWKRGKTWLIEVPPLAIMTQGHTRKEALEMAKDSVSGFIECYFEDKKIKGLSIEINDYKNGTIGVTANDIAILLSLSLIKQREKSGTTIREASKRIKSKSPNAYAQYEKGNVSPSFDKYEELLVAANPQEQFRVVVECN